MASFNPSVPDIQPNRKLSDFSQGTTNASLQPLAEVPQLSTKVEQPDYRANKSVGSLFEGVGEVGKAGLTLTDNIIKQNIDDTLNTGINKIRDSFGVAAALNGDAGKEIGKAGEEGVSLAGDAATPQPLGVQRLEQRVGGLYEKYQQGGLSNTDFYGKMEAAVRQVKQQFPGYSDEIDTMVSNKLGTNPANALRASIRADVDSLAKKVEAQNDKWTTFERANSQYIYTQWPNYDQLKANGQAPGRLDVEAAVGRLQARDYHYTAGMAAIAANKAQSGAVADQAESLTTQKAGDLAGRLIVTIPNQLGIKSPADFTNLMNDVRNGKRPPLTPDEKAQLSGVYATMEQQYGLDFDKFINTPLSANTSETMASRLGNPSKIQEIKKLGMSQLADLKSGLIDEKFGLLAQTANWSKATNEAGEGDFLRRAPVGPYVAAARKAYGDQGIMMLITQAPYIQSAALEGFRQFNQGAMAAGDKSIKEVFDTYRNEGINDAELNRKSLADGVSTILHSEKMEDPTLAPKAVQHLFGPKNNTLLSAFNDKNQVDVFTQLVSPTMVKKIEKMDNTSKAMFTAWADEAVTQVFPAQVSQANNTANSYKLNGNLSIRYDPEAQDFTYQRATGSKTPSSVVDGANRQLSSLNAVVGSMKEVWKLEGKNPTEAMHEMLPRLGIDPDSPIYKALDKEFLKTHVAGEGVFPAVRTQ